MFDSFKKKLSGFLWGTDERDVLIKKIEDLLISNDVSYEAAQHILYNLEKNKFLSSKTYLMNEIEKICRTGESIPFKSQTILLIGLPGSGKTSFMCKLAKHLMKNSKNVTVFTTDLVREAGQDQVFSMCSQNGINFKKYDFSSAIDIASAIRGYSSDIKIIDTSAIRGDFSTIEKIISITSPTEILGVFNSTTAYQAIEIQKELKNLITGIVLTSTEVDNKGGSFISLPYLFNKPIRFVTNGEKINNIEKFDCPKLIKRLSGEMDIEGASEAIEDIYTPQEVDHMMNKIKSSEFNYEDLKLNLEKISSLNMGWLLSILNVKSSIKEDNLKHFIDIINSLTIKERRNPGLFEKDISRQRRVEKGSGRSFLQIQSIIMFRKYFSSNMKNMENMNLSSIMDKLKSGSIN
jgi:signal recognition particle subunit SRP54